MGLWRELTWLSPSNPRLLCLLLLVKFDVSSSTRKFSTANDQEDAIEVVEALLAEEDKISSF